MTIFTTATPPPPPPLSPPLPQMCDKKIKRKWDHTNTNSQNSESARFPGNVRGAPSSQIRFPQPFGKFWQPTRRWREPTRR